MGLLRVAGALGGRGWGVYYYVFVDYWSLCGVYSGIICT